MPLTHQTEWLSISLHIPCNLEKIEVSEFCPALILLLYKIRKRTGLNIGNYVAVTSHVTVYDIMATIH